LAVLAYLLMGTALLLGLIVLGRLFAAANPSTLAQIVRWSAIVLVLLLASLLLFRGQAAVAAGLAGVAAVAWKAARLVPLWAWFRLWQSGRGWQRARTRTAGAAGRQGTGAGSKVETEWLRMILDHASGAIDGEVLRGPFAGRKLAALSLAQLLDLLGACTSDESSARLLEAFLDRAHPEWQEARQRRAGEAHGGDGGRMSREEALEILGLGPEAGEAEIKEAHRRLMMQYHPDRGGSDYLAAKINRAKEVLLDG
jgi:hypothetical protein